MTTAFHTLRSVVRTTFRSLPPAVRKALSGTRIFMPPQLRLGGRRVSGAARGDGRVVVIDGETVEEDADDEGELEGLVAHELAHCFRALRGQAEDDTALEEIGAERLVKSWGFRRGKYT